ncbi:MAG: hypothetical protein A3D24_00485 [Candidatus Blackburnbacteria bacterium RIFCSPHIGHO2_02_FULL_39_13]|uniref:R3H domain-containing protein n=1 Tax=Candidatus Blackburnbacteria bacterium RIFCSPLOWO2_01_FULL_40_20 TaxID=1797519 RepID=A0A1G1VFX3_9BACT|nr:MAG: Single-stranded nucleic acid binding R3H domain protein [Microgenomates group bacterium GW2011_GWA2_39_19]OGY07552.1 MAG: hypothetical protein A2694_04835 [Candidatus Blackburnbacteria bacterium RIFCSPHIGHO2_01_FULL_40_17]OGY08635.1 MAG: hypothetical protein A3D24_00485 [Candidatus Blackburnbacteria bacterium RIFCSPHIGHO2_02_FULL_39_13]OGY14269.1 MAG: hypothetical protein A3A77_02230 [Candidatus Blackburnbacteria bacterium RIFCSPLOWO2_01_FULL_40_20]OGY14596.1 MAG: hypothetical protein A
MAKEEFVNITKEVVEQLLSLMGIEAKISVSEEEENILVNIETEDTGILIGKHGETLEALQFILGVVLQKRTGEWKRVAVDTGGYRDKQSESLQRLATETAAKVKESGQPHSLFDLSPNQRRIVHTILSDDPGVVTESEGEGRERHLVVKPRE